MCFVPLSKQVEMIKFIGSLKLHFPQVKVLLEVAYLPLSGRGSKADSASLIDFPCKRSVIIYV